MAAEWRRGAEADGAAVPLADGRAANRPAQGAQTNGRNEHSLEQGKMAETRENTGFFAGFMVYFSHGKDKRTPRKKRGNDNHFQSGIRGAAGEIEHQRGRADSSPFEKPMAARTAAPEPEKAVWAVQRAAGPAGV